MNDLEFQNAVNKQLDYCKTLLGTKKQEYNKEMGDRLDTFKKAANLQCITAKQALAGMMAKHTISIYDFIEKDAAGEKITVEKWTEKITDSINYLLLLKALIEEENDVKL